MDALPTMQHTIRLTPPERERRENMEEKMSIKDVTPAVKSAVTAYLVARAYSETMREKVNEAYREALEIFALYTDATFGKESRRKRSQIERIYSPDKMYLSGDEETVKAVYEDVNFHLRKKGLKPDAMPDDHCPALVAEHLQSKTELLVLDASANMLGMGIDGTELNLKLLCGANGKGLEQRQRFIDLVAGLVVNLPDFKSPI